jgi:U1 small nuclear ribonucleoprotein
LERGNGRKVDGERVIVDYERGRTNKDWLPRTLGGGKGDSRRDREMERVVRDLKKTTEELRSKSRSVDKKIKAEKVETSIKEEKKEPASTNGKDSSAVKKERSRSRGHSRGRDDKRGDKRKRDTHDPKRRDRKERDKSEPKIVKSEPGSTDKVATSEVKKEDKSAEAEDGEITV